MSTIRDALEMMEKLRPPVDPTDVKWGMIFPLAWSAVVCGVGYTLLRKNGRTPHWPVVLAIGVGWVVAWVMTGGVTRPFPPVDAIQWLAYVGAALLLLGLGDALVRVPTILRWLVALLVSAATAWLVTANHRQTTWSPAQTAVWVPALSIAMFAIWLALDELTKRVSGATVAFSLTAIAGFSAVVIGMSGSQSLGNRAGTLALLLLPVWVVGMFRKDMSLARGTALLFVPLWTGLLLVHHLYSSSETSPTVSLILLAAVPFFMWLGAIPAVSKRSTWQRGVARGAIVLVPLLVATGMVAVPFVRAMASGASGEDSAESYYYK